MTSLHVFSNTSEWYVASDLDDAKAAVREHYENHLGVEPHEFDDQCAHTLDLHQSPDEEPLRIIVDEDGDPSDDGEVVERTCSAWAALRGRGFLCTTEF